MTAKAFLYDDDKSVKGGRAEDDDDEISSSDDQDDKKDEEGQGQASQSEPTRVASQLMTAVHLPLQSRRTIRANSTFFYVECSIGRDSTMHFFS